VFESISDLLKVEQVSPLPNDLIPRLHLRLRQETFIQCNHISFRHLLVTGVLRKFPVSCVIVSYGIRFFSRFLINKLA